ncbi:unnamed protein product [Arabidopsis thaliana]|uniref:(thale cress) hypothetical protein n=1 Tax=Arabidopsis thaliana TaxID=3702 RepID=A0A7G2FDS1_ARATH|nr:unnamed protein product [Arabidopsis thaliana]
MTLQGSSGVNNGGYVNQCAACRHQRRRCTPDCFFRPYFPAERHQEFQNFHRLHSNTRLQKRLKELGLSPEEQREAMSSIIYESNIRSQFPVGGCHEYIFHLRTQIALVTAELLRTRAQITAAFFNPTAVSFFNSAANNFLDPSSAVNPFRNLTANNDDGTIEFLSGGGYCGNFVGSNLSHANANENDVNLEALEQEQLGGAPRNNDIERVFREFFTDEEIMSLLEAQVSRHKCAYQSTTKDDDFPFP